MNERDSRHRLAEARVARLATADAAGAPHVIPCVFALAGGTLYWAVDAKPKRSPALKRLRNIGANPRVELVVDHYSEDWQALWWVRAIGTARTVQDEDERREALALLCEKYPQYRERPPDGPFVAVDVNRLVGWQASELADRGISPGSP
jgi:PPOX class probable F420-dependent enzyme